MEQDAKDPRDKYIAERLNSRVYFVSVNGKDPSDEFLKRFQGVPRTAKRMSDAKQTKKPGGGWVIDKKNQTARDYFQCKCDSLAEGQRGRG